MKKLKKEKIENIRSAECPNCNVINYEYEPHLGKYECNSCFNEFYIDTKGNISKIIPSILENIFKSYCPECETENWHKESEGEISCSDCYVTYYLSKRLGL